VHRIEVWILVHLLMRTLSTGLQPLGFGAGLAARILTLSPSPRG